MAYTMRELTDTEKETCLKDYWWGVLSFSGDEPYAIPLGYQYIKGDVIVGFALRGRKMDYVNKSRNVCFTICRPSLQANNINESYPYSSVIIEGELEEITDRAYYGLKPLPEGVKIASFRIKQKRVGTLQLGLTP